MGFIRRRSQPVSPEASNLHLYRCLIQMQERYSHVHDMMGGGMMWGMDLLWLALIVVVILAIAVLVKYLFFR